MNYILGNDVAANLAVYALTVAILITGAILIRKAWKWIDLEDYRKSRGIDEQFRDIPEKVRARLWAQAFGDEKVYEQNVRKLINEANAIRAQKLYRMSFERALKEALEHRGR